MTERLLSQYAYWKQDLPAGTIFRYDDGCDSCTDAVY